MLILLLWFIHDDDPKLLDLQPRYEGPGFRAAQNRSAGPNFPNQNIELLSWVPLTELGNSGSGNDCWGYTSPAGREYAIMGTDLGTAFIEVTDPENAQVITFLSGSSSLWRDVKVYQNVCYAVSEGGGGIQVFDLSQIDSGVVSLATTIQSGGESDTHNVAIDEVSGYLYRCGGLSTTGLRIYDLTDPLDPEYVTTWSDKYVHDTQVKTFTSGPYAGRQIAFANAGFNGGFSQTGLSIIDVTNKSNLVVLDHYQYSTSAYSHQGWLSQDGQTFFINDELDEKNLGMTTTTRLIDVSDLENPFEMGTFTNGNSAIDHNLYTKDDLVFAANYRSGLRVHRFNGTTLEEVAFFDTYPENNNAQFNGLWSSYPYFSSGTIIGSDLEKGLFVWRLNLTPMIGDINNDFKVDEEDWRIWLPTWRGCQDCPSDVDGNGSVEVLDAVLIRNNQSSP